MKIIVLGATGMLGYEVFKICLQRGLDVHGIVRNKELLVSKLGQNAELSLHLIDDIRDFQHLSNLVGEISPSHIINCIGIVKQSILSENYYESVSINSLLPHQLANICEKIGCRLIHISTDCVFDGRKGMYLEDDLPNADDLYGKSKHLGEVNYGNNITLRTSIIGHEILNRCHGLVEWFLSQKESVNGFNKAFFSGFTTLELTKIIIEQIIEKNIPPGLYHVAAERISKYDLISKINRIYNKKTSILPSEDLIIDRSLNGERFNNISGYVIPSWEQLIFEMKLDFDNSFKL